MSDSLKTVGIVSTGDMGQAVGRVLITSGLRAVTFAGDRSNRTRGLAEGAGIESLASLAEVLQASDLFLSLVPPAAAREMAERAARSLKGTTGSVVYADCNSVSPGTVREMATIIEEAGSSFIDVAIIGQPPRVGQALGGGTPRFYVSGERAEFFMRLREHGIDVRVLPGPAGQASGLKMCYAALLKGLTALSTNLLMAGTLMGLKEPLEAELAEHQALLADVMKRQLPLMPPKAYRWVGEMQEMARTYFDLGLPSGFFTSAAALFDLVAGTELGHEIPEQRKLGTDLDEVVRLLADAVRDAPPAAGPLRQS